MLSAADYGTGAWGDYSFAASDTLPMTITRNASGSWAEGATYNAGITVTNYAGTPFTVTGTMSADGSGFYPFTGAAQQQVTVNGNGIFNFAGWTSTDDSTDHTAQRQGASLSIDDGQP
jgi:hypothetical protein